MELSRQDSQRFTRGLEIRREVLGDEYVDNSLSESDEFMMTFQHIVTELAWGLAWDGAALDPKTKSILSIGIPAALGRFEEVESYTNGALATGVTVSELRDVLTHVSAIAARRPVVKPFWPHTELFSPRGLLRCKPGISGLRVPRRFGDRVVSGESS